MKKMKRTRLASRNIKLTLAYDGTDFCGWQIQKGQRTVQGVVEEALGHIHGSPIRVGVAGRTDSGVHADGQVISFLSDCTVPDERFVNAINSQLPRDVRALSSICVPNSFHARFSAQWREYKYYIRQAAYSDPFSRFFCLTVKRDLNLKVLNGYASRLVGTHDFTTFAAAGDQSRSKIRAIRSASFYQKGPYIIFRIIGNAFLWKMVRSLIGTILDHVADRHHIESFDKILSARDRSLAGSTAPAKGLSLYRVIYDG